MKKKLEKLEKYWVLYDVGNSAFALLVSTIIPIYFKNMAAAAGVENADSTAYLSYAISISTVIVAILGPVLGAVADHKNHKKPLFTFFMIPCWLMSRRMRGWTRSLPRDLHGAISEAVFRL